MIGWTTVATEEDAGRLAREIVANRLAACVQISPIRSIYRWEGAIEQGQEYRLAIKFVAVRETELEQWLGAHHPYETPQWICCPAMAGSEKYLNWVVENST